MSKNTMLLVAVAVGGFVLYKYASASQPTPGVAQTGGSVYPPSSSGSSGSGGDNLWHDILGTAQSIFNSAGSYFGSRNSSQG